MKLLTLSIPGYPHISAPAGLPANLQGNNSDPNGTHLLSVVLQLLLVGAVLLALGVLIISGISWASSGGDKQKLEQSRNRIIYAIIGLILALAAFFIVKLIGTLFNVSLLG